MNKKNALIVVFAFFVVLSAGIIAPGSVFGQQAGRPDSVPQLGEATLLQQAMNRLPAVPIAGNNLQFVFGGDVWIARLNGRDFLAGTFLSQETDEGTILVLKQTHIYPPRQIPGIRWIRTPGPEIVLEYKDGPPASISLVSRSGPDTGLVKEQVTSTEEPASTEPASKRKPALLATFGIGGQFLKGDFYGSTDDFFLKWPRAPSQLADNKTVPKGTTVGGNIIFIGGGGFSVSIGVDAIFRAGDFGDYGVGINIDPIFGLGYVYYNKFYVGGILNVIMKAYGMHGTYDSHHYRYAEADGFITPTLVGGYDFNGFILGTQLSFMYGLYSGVPGFKFSLVVGVNVLNR